MNNNKNNNNNNDNNNNNNNVDINRICSTSFLGLTFYYVMIDLKRFRRIEKDPSQALLLQF